MKAARYILLLALLALLVAGILWARDKSRQEICHSVQVQVMNDDDSTHFVTPAGVLEVLERQHIIVKDKPVWKINLQELEQILSRSQYLEHVECLFESGGRLKIRVWQIVPVMRVFDGDESYYVNKDGKRMDAVTSFHANVPVVEGHFTKSYSPLRLLPMIQYVERDSALKALVTMYYMNDSNNIFIVPAVRGHVVNMGNCDGFENKFAKLKLFYKKVMPVKGWMCYDTISVKWDYQVVATKRDKAVIVVQEYDPSEDEQPDDPGTMQGAGGSRAPVNKMTRDRHSQVTNTPAVEKPAPPASNNASTPQQQPKEPPKPTATPAQKPAEKTAATPAKK